MYYTDSQTALTHTVTLDWNDSTDLQTRYKTQVKVIQGSPEMTTTESMYLLAGA